MLHGLSVESVCQEIQHIIKTAEEAIACIEAAHGAQIRMVSTFSPMIIW